MRGESGHIPRHPLGGALRVSEEPPRAAFLAGVERLWLGPFTPQNENAGLDSHSAWYKTSVRSPTLTSIAAIPTPPSEVPVLLKDCCSSRRTLYIGSDPHVLY